jgi:prepilin peptidase CpaA
MLRTLLDYFPLLALLLVAAAIDVRQRRIPNWLTFGLILSGLARGMVFSGGDGLFHATAGMFAGAFIPFILFVLGALGGGDVKLLAGIGAWVGPTEALAIFLVECIIGLFFVLIQAAIQGRTIALFRNSAVLAAGFAHQGISAGSPASGQSVTTIDRPLPYAVPVALATVLVLWQHSGWTT